MKPEQKKKWEKKIAMAKKADNKSAANSQEKTGDPDMNMIRKKFKEDKEDLPLEPDWRVFAYVAVGILALTFAPMLIAIGFSIWTGTRPCAPPAPTRP